jgi:hypothetical protein
MGEEIAFKKWIFKIAKFKAIDYCRKEIKNLDVSIENKEISTNELVEEEFIKIEERNEILSLINTLESMDRDIFVMKFFLGEKKEAIFDGRTLTYTYEIVSYKDLGENPFLSMNGPSIVIKDYSGGTGGGSIVKRVANNTYVGEEDISINEERKSLRFGLNFTSIGDMSSDDSTPINGEWKFKIDLKALDNVKQVLNKETEKDGAKLVISSISKTPVSFTLNCTQEISKEIRDKYLMVENPILEVKDDLGNSYISTRDILIKDRMYWIESALSFGALNPNATKLIITPKLSFTNDVHSAKVNSDGELIKISSVIDENHPKKGEIILDDIVIDLEK